MLWESINPNLLHPIAKNFVEHESSETLMEPCERKQRAETWTHVSRIKMTQPENNQIMKTKQTYSKERTTHTAQQFVPHRIEVYA